MSIVDSRAPPGRGSTPPSYPGLPRYAPHARSFAWSPGATAATALRAIPLISSHTRRGLPGHALKILAASAAAPRDILVDTAARRAVAAVAPGDRVPRKRDEGARGG